VNPDYRINAQLNQCVPLPPSKRQWEERKAYWQRYHDSKKMPEAIKKFNGPGFELVKVKITTHKEWSKVDTSTEDTGWKVGAKVKILDGVRKEQIGTILQYTNEKEFVTIGFNVLAGVWAYWQKELELVKDES
jgi:transcription antitermination factor NusG